VWSWWPVLFLAGPVVWYLYFWVVYLAAEAGCAFGFRGVSVFTVVLTIFSAITVGAFALLARRRSSRRQDGDYRQVLVQAGFLLGVMFLIGTVFVGVPALVLQPC